MKLVLLFWLLIAATIIVFCAAGIYPIHTRNKNKIWIWSGVFFTYISLIILSMTYTPRSAACDLYRHLEKIENYTNSSWSICVRNMTEVGSPAWELVCFLVSKLNNPSAIQGIAVTVAYGVIILFVVSFSKVYKPKQQGVAVYLILLFCTYGYSNVWGGIRLPIAWAITAFCVYEYTQNGFKLYMLPLELFSFFIHSAGIIPILIVFSTRWILRSSASRKLFLVAIILGTAVAQFFVNSSNVYISTLARKAIGYQADKIYHIAMRVYLAEILVVIILNLYFIFSIKRKMGLFPKQMKQYFGYYEALLLFTTGSVVANQIFNRFFLLLMCSSLPLIAYMYKNVKKGCVPYPILAIIPGIIVIFMYNIHIFTSAYVAV